jgi:hypothetical protein
LQRHSLGGSLGDFDARDAERDKIAREFNLFKVRFFLRRSRSGRVGVLRWAMSVQLRVRVCACA